MHSLKNLVEVNRFIALMGGSKHLWNVGRLQRDYTEPYPYNSRVQAVPSFTAHAQG
jgi:hypothetical protein